MFRIQKTTLLCALIALAALLVLQPATAQIIFSEDFEGSDPGWAPDNGGQIWEITPDFPNGTAGYLNTVEGCGNSGNTPIGFDNFSDGIIQLEMSWGDDDSWGIVLRKTADDAGYLVVFGYNETPSVIIADLADGCADTGNCLDQVGCENGGNELLQVDHGLGADLTQDNSVSYTGRIEAIGDTIKVWYLPTADVASPTGDLGAPTVEFQTDGAHSGPGSVGVYQESQGGCMIDNVWVTGAAGITPVEPQGKLAASWGRIKSTY